MRWILSAILFLSSISASAQSTFANLGPVSTPTVGVFINEINSGTQYHQVVWRVNGTVATCTLQLDSSVDGSTPVLGGIISSQTCTSNGSSSIVNSVNNYARINVTGITGGGTVTIAYSGYPTNPTPGGPPSGAAGGDLNGTYPNPGVANVQGVSYSACASPSTNTVPVITGSNTATCEAVPNSALANSIVTISGHAVSLGSSVSLAAADVGLGNVTNDAQTKAAVVPNTAPSAGQIPIGNAGGTAYAPQTVSGSCTLTSAGVMSCSGGISGLTTNTIPKATSATTIGNSSVIDTGTGPTQTPNGLDLVQSGLGDEYTVDTGGVTANKLACRSSTNKVVICPVNATTTVLGVALSTVTSGGTVKLCFIGKCSVVSSNNFTAGNWAIPSASVAGDIDDTGSTFQPTTGTQTFLEQSTGSAGAQVVIDMLTPDTLNATGGGKAITPNSTITAIPYLSAANVYSDSPLFRLDGNTIEQHNSTTAQTLNIYQSYTSGTTNHGIKVNGSTISTFANGADVSSAMTINSGASPLSLSVAALPGIQLTSAPSIKMLNPVTVYAVNASPSTVANTGGAGAVYILGGGTNDQNAIASASATVTAFTTGGLSTGAGEGGTYRFTWSYQCQTAVAGAQVTGTVSWTDRNSNSHSRSITLDCSSTSNEVSANFLMNVKASVTVSVTTVITNGGGTAAYDARFFAEQME